MLFAAPWLLRPRWDSAFELVPEERGRECGFHFRADSVKKSHIRVVRSSQLVIVPHEKAELDLGGIPSVRPSNDGSQKFPNCRSRTRLRLAGRFGTRLTRSLLGRDSTPVRW